MATFSISHVIAESNDSDSASGAESFDEEYYHNKPPPLEYSEELIKRIVHVGVDNGAQVHDALQSVNGGQFKSNVFMLPYNKAADLENKNDPAANNVPNYFYNNKASPVLTGADSSLAIAKKLQTSNTGNSGPSEKLNKQSRRSRRNKNQFNNHEYRSDKSNGSNNVDTFYNNKPRPLKYEDLVNQIVHVRNNDKTEVPGEESMNKERPLPSNVNDFVTIKGQTDPTQAKERRPSNNKSGFNNRNPAAIHQATNIYQNNTKFVTCYNCTAKIIESLLSDHLEICTKIRDQVHISLPEDIVAPTPVIQDDANILEYDNKCSRFCFWCFCPKFCF